MCLGGERTPQCSSLYHYGYSPSVCGNITYVDYRPNHSHAEVLVVHNTIAQSHRFVWQQDEVKCDRYPNMIVARGLRVFAECTRNYRRRNGIPVDLQANATRRPHETEGNHTIAMIRMIASERPWGRESVRRFLRMALSADCFHFYANEAT